MAGRCKKCEGTTTYTRANSVKGLCFNCEHGLVREEPIVEKPKSLVQEIADFIRTYDFVQGDQYGTWLDKSSDAEELARAVEVNFCERD